MTCDDSSAYNAYFMRERKFGANLTPAIHFRTVLTDGYEETPKPFNSGVSDPSCQARESLNRFNAQTPNVVEPYQ